MTTTLQANTGQTSQTTPTSQTTQATIANTSAANTASGSVYTVKPGDYLYRIANNYGVTVNEIIQ